MLRITYLMLGLLLLIFALILLVSACSGGSQMSGGQFVWAFCLSLLLGLYYMGEATEKTFK